MMAELYSSTSMSKSSWSSNVTDQQLKSASLPPGLALPSGCNKLSRSRSNAGTKQGDMFKEEEEEDKAKEEKKKEESFFGRFLARRSGKKQIKKTKSDDVAVEQIYKTVEERRTGSIDEFDQSISKSINESYSAKSENMFSYKQIDEQDNKMIEGEKQMKKVKSDDFVFGTRVDVQEKLKKIKNDDFNVKISESIEKQVKKIKSEEVKTESFEKQLKKLKTEDINIEDTEKTSVIKINENLIIEKHSKKIKSDEVVIKSSEIEKQTKKIKSDDYILIKTGDSMSLYKQSEERKNSMDSNIRNSALPRSGPAARQRILPIDIPASPDSFRQNKRQQNLDVDVLPPLEQTVDHSPPKLPPKNEPTELPHPKPAIRIPINTEPKPLIKNSPDSPTFLVEHSLSKSIKNSPEQPSFLLHHNSPPKPRFFQVNRQIKVGTDDKPMEIEEPESPPQISPKPLWCDHSDDKTSKIKIAGLSSYQQRVISHDEHDFKSLGDNNEKNDSKSHNFKSKITSETPVTRSDTIDSFSSNTSIEMYDSLNRNEPLSFTSHSDSVECSPDEQKDKTEGITISCVNSQILTSVNSANQVIVNISNNNESTERDSENQVSQVMVTRVQLKRDVKSTEISSEVPEFLKIQLNKVDVKPSNVVLTTSVDTGVQREVEKENEVQRKFSKDDVEIIDKETSEEMVEFSKLIQAKTDELNKKQVVAPPKTERKNSVSPPLSAKPFLRRKSNSIEITDSQEHEKHIEQKPEKTASVGDLIESPEPVILRRKSSASVKKEKDSDEPELMKVFARRSLKLKDSEAETLSQQVMILVENSQADEMNDNTTTKSRDSDKENEFADSPQEERKKFQPPKETKPLNESKFVETTEVTLRKPINNKIAQFNKTPNKTSSLTITPVIDTQDIKKNSKSYIEPKNEKPKIFEKNITRTTKIIAFNNKDVDNTKKADVINNKIKSEVITTEVITNVKNNENENDEYVPMFKRISQRKEEWEQRAQQAMKKTVP